MYIVCYLSPSFFFPAQAARNTLSRAAARTDAHALDRESDWSDPDRTKASAQMDGPPGHVSRIFAWYARQGLDASGAAPVFKS